MWTYVIGPLLALLPARWRRGLGVAERVSWRRAALVSGILECTGCLGGLIAWYFRTIQLYIGAFTDSAMNSRAPVAAGADQIKTAALILFVLHPLTWALAYFAFEGLVRTCATAFGGETPATLPLALIDGLIARVQRKRALAKTPLVPDVVVRGAPGQGWDVKVASCRAKPDWQFPQTVFYEGEFYQVKGERPGEATPMRPHVYVLQRKHRNEAARGMVHYDAEHDHENATPSGEGWGEFRRALREKYWTRRLPEVEDEVIRSVADGIEWLEIRASRPKEGWAPGRLMRTGDAYYRIETAEHGTPPRPFVWRLRRIEAGVPSRKVLVYEPAELTR